MDEELYNMPIRIDDACMMLRKNITKNERPYVVEAIKFNNDMVNEWKKEVLDQVCSPDGKIASGKIPTMWITFEEGKTIHKYMELRKEGLLPEFNMKAVYYWRDFFENLTVSEMKEYSWVVVSKGWGYLNSYILDHFFTKKWEALYSHNNDPLYWEKNSHLISTLSKGKPHPFWEEDVLKDIQQKVETLLSNPVRPS